MAEADYDIPRAEALLAATIAKRADGSAADSPSVGDKFGHELSNMRNTLQSWTREQKQQ